MADWETIIRQYIFSSWNCVKTSITADLAVLDKTGKIEIGR